MSRTSLRGRLSLARSIRGLPAVTGLVVSTFFWGCSNQAPEGSATERDGAESSGRASVVFESRDAATVEDGKAENRFIGDRLSGTEYVSAAPEIPQEPSPFRFTDIREPAGIDFVHVSGITEEKLFPTSNGSGAAVFDYDGDGLMDLYFGSFNFVLPDAPKPGRNRLYRNRGDGTFEDVTEASGLGFVGTCTGIVVGDYDNDGDPDVVLCNFGTNVLYQNNGDGTFHDVTESAGLQRPGWSTSGAFLDHDNDGDLDLYISNYGIWNYQEDNDFCGDPESGTRLYCSPRSIRTTQHFFYRNNGDGTFSEVAEEVGLAREPSQQGHGFGVAAADLNDDNLIDLYVANDMNPNFLFLNNGDGTFRDMTELSGAAFDDKGNAQSGMGVDAEDVDGDGRPELFVTNFSGEYNTLYQNLGNGVFYDQTPSFGLAADAMPWVAWGTGLVDLDNDGWPDAFVATGHVDNNRPGVEHAQPPLLHRNVPLGNGPDASRRFKIATRDVGPYFDAKHVTRGVAFGDIDNDGDLDIITNNYDDHPGILRNDTPTASENGWIRLVLTGTRSSRDAIGSKVEVTARNRTIYRQLKGGTSIESSHDPRLLIGIGPAKTAERVIVRWPSGALTERENVPSGTTLELEEPANDSVALGRPVDPEAAVAE